MLERSGESDSVGHSGEHLGMCIAVIHSKSFGIISIGVDLAGNWNARLPDSINRSARHLSPMELGGALELDSLSFWDGGQEQSLSFDGKGEITASIDVESKQIVVQGSGAVVSLCGGSGAKIVRLLRLHWVLSSRPGSTNDCWFVEATAECAEGRRYRGKGCSLRDLLSGSLAKRPDSDSSRPFSRREFVSLGSVSLAATLAGAASDARGQDLAESAAKPTSKGTIPTRLRTNVGAFIPTSRVPRSCRPKPPGIIGLGLTDLLKWAPRAEGLKEANAAILGSGQDILVSRPQDMLFLRFQLSNLRIGSRYSPAGGKKQSPAQADFTRRMTRGCMTPGWRSSSRRSQPTSSSSLNPSTSRSFPSTAVRRGYPHWQSCQAEADWCSR